MKLFSTLFILLLSLAQIASATDRTDLVANANYDLAKLMGVEAHYSLLTAYCDQKESCSQEACYAGIAKSREENLIAFTKDGYSAEDAESVQATQDYLKKYQDLFEDQRCDSSEQEAIDYIYIWRDKDSSSGFDIGNG